MFRDTDRELARLEAALLEEETPMQPEPEEPALETPPEYRYEDTRAADGPVIYQNYSNDYGSELRNYASGYRAYNSDMTDTDLDDYSEEVQKGASGGGVTALVVIACLLTLGILVLLLLWLLWTKGVL